HEPRGEGDLLLGAVEAGDEARDERQGAARDHAGDDDGGDGRGPAGDAGLSARGLAPSRRASRAYSANASRLTTVRCSTRVEAGDGPPYNDCRDEVLAPTAPAERTDGRPGAARGAALAGASGADRSRTHRPHAGRHPAADRSGVRVARPHGSLHGLRPAPSPVPRAPGPPPPLPSPS